MAARANGLAIVDGVYNDIPDLGGLARECAQGADLGFDGKSLIHPNQIEPCHRAFTPSAAEIERARALVDAFKGGAERFGNEMIERMHVQDAERVLERAGG
jgi:citrate lyase subunit beta/citryl-CoA lyase